LNVWLSVPIWGVTAAAVCIGMARITNRKAMQQQEELQNAAETSYRWNRTGILLFLAVVAVSFCCGYITAGKTVSLTAWLTLICAYAAVLSAAVIDRKLQIIPNYIPLALLLFIGLILLYEGLFTDSGMLNLISSVLGCVLCWLGLMLAERLSSGGIGMGDVKLLAALGFACGAYTVFLTLLLALLCCILVSVVLLLQKKVTWKAQLPFGPFILVGYWGMIFLTYV